MSEDGYTLAETLAALVMIGLAVGGLTAGVRVIARGQAMTAKHIARGRDLEAVQATLASLLVGQGPFESVDQHGLQGRADQFSFDCAAARSCGASLSSEPEGERLTIRGRDGLSALRLTGVRAARFTYAGQRQISANWPPGGTEPDRLASVIVLADLGRGETPLANVRLWREQPPDCAFDPISQTCRAVGP